jgi:hypothetical protein
MWAKRFSRAPAVARLSPAQAACTASPTVWQLERIVLTCGNNDAARPRPADPRNPARTFHSPMKLRWDDCSHLLTRLWMTVDGGAVRVDRGPCRGGRSGDFSRPSTDVHDGASNATQPRPHPGAPSDVHQDVSSTSPTAAMTTTNLVYGRMNDTVDRGSGQVASDGSRSVRRKARDWSAPGRGRNRGRHDEEVRHEVPGRT